MYIFLYGNDTFRSLEKLGALKSKYLEKNSSGTDLSVLDYEDNEAKNFQSVMMSQGLFSSKRFVVLKNILTKTTVEHQKEMLQFLKSNSDLENDSDLIAIFFESQMPKKNTALFKYLESHSKKQEFELLSGIKLANWTLAYSKSIAPEISFTRNALNMLLAATGNDLYLLSNEINKLASFKNFSGTIADEDIELLVKSRVESTMFETIEALLSGNKSLALKLFHQQLEKGEDVFYILSMYAYQIRTLLKVGDFYWRGITNAFEIAKSAKIHPYVVQKTLSQVHSLSEEKAKKIFKDLAQIDQDAKTGKVDPVLALDTFIVSL